MASTYPGMVDDIMDYESGQMSEDDIPGFFQRLVNSGAAWSLQGHYGRTAQQLIDAGIISAKGKPGR